MKYFIDGSRNVYAYESDGSQDDFIKGGLIPISDEELMAIRAEQDAANAPSPEQLLQDANTKRDRLLWAAALRIAPLQDAADLEEATDEEVSSLKAWKKYRVAVGRVVDQRGYPNEINWPEEPL